VDHFELKTYPDPCLRIKTKSIGVFDAELQKTIKFMSDTMYVSRGIGLAAPQVGLGLCLLVVDVGDGLLTLINPEIVEEFSKKATMEEGCLSLPGISVKVSRPSSIKVRYQDGSGDFNIKMFEDLVAIAIQHEMDHLDGKMIIDYLNPISYFFAVRKLSNIKNNNQSCEVVCNVGTPDK